jgi:hypothetical protein
MTTMVLEILETKLNKMIFHAYKSTLRINIGQTNRTVSSVYNDFERILNGPEFESWSEEIFSSPDITRSAPGPTQPPLQWVLELFSWDRVAVI